MMRARLFSLAIVMLLLPSGAIAGTGPDHPVVACPTPDPALPGAPALPAVPLTAVTRSDGSNDWTNLLIDEPADPVTAYEHATISTSSGDVSFAFTHDWLDAPQVTTIGAVTPNDGAGAGWRYTPMAAIESTTPLDINPDVAAAIDILATSLYLIQSTPVEPFRTTPFADQAPVFVWGLIKRPEQGQQWVGLVRTYEGDHVSDGPGYLQGCRRIQVSLVTRGADGATVYSGVGVSITHGARYEQEGDTTRSEHTITVASASPAGDVPVAVYHTSAETVDLGAVRSEQGDVSVGIILDDGSHQPLLGARRTSVYAPAPEAENTMFSLGAYDRAEGYHPQVGARIHGERLPFLDWLFNYAGSPMFGSQEAGDWEVDLGAFDPYGTFLPLAGLTWDDSLDTAGRNTPTGIVARHDHQSLLTAGAWVGESYQPLLGLTYDGGQTLAEWADGPQSETEDRAPWLISTGVFAGPARYAPALGLAFTPGTRNHADETYDVGTFVGYDTFIPLARAERVSDRPTTMYSPTATSHETIQAGTVGPDGDFIPVVRIDHDAESDGDQRAALTLVTPAGEVAIVEACTRQIGDSAAANVHMVLGGSVGVGLDPLQEPPVTTDATC